MYGIADGNNFYVSCERVFQPHLVNKPVIVKSANQYSDLLHGGCVIARSNDVKAMGIKMGTPIYQIRDLIRRAGIFVLPTNFELYGDLSDRMIYLLSTMAERVQKYSIDYHKLNIITS